MMIATTVLMPPISSGNAENDTAAQMIYEKKINEHVKRELKIKGNYTKVY